MRFTARSCLIAAAGVVACSGVAEAVGEHYKPHDPVYVVANKVGPFNNPSETYEVTLTAHPEAACTKFPLYLAPTLSTHAHEAHTKGPSSQQLSFSHAGVSTPRRRAPPSSS